MRKYCFVSAFIFFVSICIPNSVEWYKHVIRINWTNLHYRDLYDIARFGSGINLFGNTIFGNKLVRLCQLDHYPGRSHHRWADMDHYCST
jgi:hypothetical protein